MKAIQKPNALARSLQRFFSDYLPRLRGVSPHTIHSYRDCLALLLRFVGEQQKCLIPELDIEHINNEQVIAFLQMIEDKRQNSASTRNVRLAAIHAFFAFFAGEHPDKLEHCQRILAIPFKRAHSRIVEYLEYNEIQAILATHIPHTKISFFPI